MSERIAFRSIFCSSFCATWPTKHTHTLSAPAIPIGRPTMCATVLRSRPHAFSIDICGRFRLTISHACWLERTSQMPSQARIMNWSPSCRATPFVSNPLEIQHPEHLITPQPQTPNSSQRVGLSAGHRRRKEISLKSMPWLPSHHSQARGRLPAEPTPQNTQGEDG